MGKRGKGKSGQKPISLEKALIYCQEFLAGAVLSIQRFREQLPRGARLNEFRGVPIATIEKYALLLFLARSWKWLDIAADAGASPRLAMKAQEFATKLTHAKVLRDMLEHLDAYEGGVGHEQHAWTATWPAAQIGTSGTRGSVIAPGAFGTEGLATIVYVDHGDTRSTATAFIAGRLDATLAMDLASSVLDAVIDELRAVQSTSAP